MRAELDELKNQLLGNNLKTNSREHEIRELELKLKSLQAENAHAIELNVELEEFKLKLICANSELAQRQTELDS